MAPFNAVEIARIANRFEPVVRQEPVLSCWRCQGGEPAHVQKAAAWREMARWGRDAFLSLKRLPRPAHGQVVVFSYASSPSTTGTLLPVLRELKRRSEPCFLITTPYTRWVLKENLHSGHVDMRDLFASSRTWRRCRISRQAEEWVIRLQELLPEDRMGNAASWIAAGLTAREAAVHWLDGAGILVAEAEHEPERKGFFLGAHLCGVPTAVLQHAILDILYLPIHADKMFTWGTYFQRPLEDLGVPQEKFKPIGVPRWDELESMRGRLRDPAVRASMGGRKEKPLILLISTTNVASTYPELYAAYFRAVRGLAGCDVDIAVRLHPAEQDLSAYASALSPSELKRLRFLTRSMGLYEAIGNADVVYQTGSSASLEAMLLDVPVLFTGEGRSQGIPGYVDYPDHGGGEWCDAGDVARRCQKLAHPGAERSALLERQSRFLDMALANRGKATEAVVTELLAMKR